MGLFDFLKPKKTKVLPDPPKNFKWHLVDNLYYMLAPDFLEFVKSDRFRLEMPGGRIRISVTNYEFSNGNPTAKKEDLENMALPLYDKYVKEGGYEPYDDLEATDSYITKSFKVDEETQYYMTAGNNFNGKLYITNFILRDLSTYEEGMRTILKVMRDSMTEK